ncbi:hypothetical protein H7171_04105 [Candidatus Saccharibacteria bacterium]|nr:hypothetical protein [Candidatus Saccharibacteria bacterium]
MKIRNLQEATAALQIYVPLIALTGTNTTLERIIPLMTALGNPEKRLRVVHIAGTSGKTSTAYYMAALLQAAGQKVGLTVSPHIDSVTERVQINGRPIADEVFCAELELFLGVVETLIEPPSYFELLYAFAIWEFGRQQVDYAVVETGLGGLHDATNVITNPNKFCIITDIGYDHMHILGTTLPKIALQKIGIVHAGNDVLTYPQSDDVMAVFEDWIRRQPAKLYTASSPKIVGAMMPQYQQRNWQLAYQAFKKIALRDGLSMLPKSALDASKLLQIPGRMEIIAIGSATVVMDGAHNQQKMEAFVASFRAKFPSVRPTILLSLKAGKEYALVVPLLATITDQIIVTGFGGSQDTPVHSMDTAELAKACLRAGVTVVLEITDHATAIKQLVAQSKICVVTGSFYLLSQLRAEGYLS